MAKRLRKRSSNAQLRPEQSRLPAGYLHFRTVTQRHVETPIVTKLNTFDKVEIDDLLAIRTEKLLCVEPQLEGCQ